MINILLDKDLTSAIIDIAYSEGLSTNNIEVWNKLVFRAELVVERKSDYHRGQK